MKYRKSYYKYIDQSAQIYPRPFFCGARDKINQVVVIPCFAESRYILKTLFSLSQNDRSHLKNTLILCVVNNRGEAITDCGVLADNDLTMACLDILVHGELTHRLPLDNWQTDLLSRILKTDLRVAFIDASSRGNEMPEKEGGVGMARKIGLDMALSLFDNNENDLRLLYCLDADTLVESNYLNAVNTFFSREQATAAHVSFAHQEAEDEILQDAIIFYEIFLRYYVAGLKHAGSPYAFHTIGSTMVCTADGYAAVRGMNKRQAGEDFYFLNKISKLDGVRTIKNTTVYPSARSSARVPFGTGNAVRKYGQENNHNYLVYNPSIFIILKQWLNLSNQFWDSDAETMLKEAEKIHTSLKLFLQMIKFEEKWRHLHANNKKAVIFKEQFNGWFDGFITLKLINFLSRNGESPINIIEAVQQLLNLMGCKINTEVGPSYDRKMEIPKWLLTLMRTEILP